MSTCSTTARSTGRWPPAASPTATSRSLLTRAGPTSTPPPARTATPPSGVSTRRPSRRLPPTRRATGCRPRSGSACAWKTTSADRTLSGNFAALVEAVARRRPEHVALRWNGGSMTYRDVAGRAAGFAEDLVARRARPRQPLARPTPHRPGFVVALLGALAADVTVAPIDVLLKDEERAAIVSDLEPALLVESAIGGDLHLLPGGGPTVPAPALVLYTSGSTGRPKGSLLSHAAL